MVILFLIYTFSLFKMGCLHLPEAYFDSHGMKIGLDLFSALGLSALSWFFPISFMFIFLPLFLFYNSLGFFRFDMLSSFVLQMFVNSVWSKLQSNLYFSSYMLGSFFLYLLLQKFWNLVPLTISVSSKMVFTLLVAFCYWVMFKISSLLKNFFSYAAHYTTPSSPLVLVPFMNVVEVISKIMRPITLGVRLAVKLLTGHLLLSLLSKKLSGHFLLFNSFSVFLIGGLGIFVFFYESCVLVMQAFVYNLMLSQYLDEHSF